MASSKSAKYFCENCGEEVAKNARFCPHCGRFFSAVRCPQCGHMGAVTVFKNGCPKCHYAMTPQDIYGTPQATPSTKQNKSKVTPKKSKSKSASRKSNYSHNDDVPIWLYVVSLIALFVIIGIAFIKMGLL